MKLSYVVEVEEVMWRCGEERKRESCEELGEELMNLAREF
jgi:hypothetical protein